MSDEVIEIDEAGRVHPPCEDLPLQARVIDGMLVIRVGVETLKFSFEEAEENNPWDPDFNDFRQKFIILDAEGFARDTAQAMNDEAEDGATPLMGFLDSMMQAATDDGSVYVEEADEAAITNKED